MATPPRHPVQRHTPLSRCGPAQAYSLIVGVLSDTHGGLDPAIVELFAGVDHIVHAGDIAERPSS